MAGTPHLFHTLEIFNKPVLLSLCFEQNYAESKSLFPKDVRL
jgi:hypothetical protein